MSRRLLRQQRGTPESFGWLRRPELDHRHPGWCVWELPDGRRYLATPDRKLVVVRDIIETKGRS